MGCYECCLCTDNTVNMRTQWTQNIKRLDLQIPHTPNIQIQYSEGTQGLLVLWRHLQKPPRWFGKYSEFLSKNMLSVHVIRDYFLYTVKKRKQQQQKIPTHFHMTVVTLRSYVLPLKVWELSYSLPPAYYSEYYSYWTFLRRTWRIIENRNSFKGSNLNHFLRANSG